MSAHAINNAQNNQRRIPAVIANTASETEQQQPNPPFNPLPTGRPVEDAVVYEGKTDGTVKQYSSAVKYFNTFCKYEKFDSKLASTFVDNNGNILPSTQNVMRLFFQWMRRPNAMGINSKPITSSVVKNCCHWLQWQLDIQCKRKHGHVHQRWVKKLGYATSLISEVAAGENQSSNIAVSPDGSPIVVYRDVLSKLDNDMTHQQFTDSITSMMGHRGEVCV